MATKIKKRGRPPRNGAARPEHFMRAVMILHAYNEARARHEKHAAAITAAINFIRRVIPEMPVSATEVKRALAEFQPQHSPMALRVNHSVLHGEEAAKIQGRYAQLLELSGTKSPMEMGDQDQRRPLHHFTFGFHKHPNYPRHNAHSASTSNPAR